MWLPSLLTAGVVLLALPALVLGVRGLFRHRGYSAAEPADRASVVTIVALRGLLLLLLLLVSAVVLVSTIGAMVVGVDLHGMVHVLFVLDLLLASSVLLTFGRRERRPARRPATPAAR
ncbi:hypothetical protein [Blastococcus xanthinilyticus]|uniref:Uncharacterized protein n=1 Tax=Blastococcus xanthinilyticus TaxID=1564164 RepID=A0A5S5CPQ1_9ACTN|nr:hypothetical protein [Blastococcus xanthinilyticus]TYP82829.1 hypothetical protein BD833_11865 [Blastococcus xanthinilyticus]